jgi:hypothetical protein
MIQVHDDDFQLIKTTLEAAQSRLQPVPGTLTLRSTILLCLAKMGLARRGYPETDPTAEEYIYISQDTSAPAHLRTVAQSHPVHSARIGDDTVEKEDGDEGQSASPWNAAIHYQQGDRVKFPDGTVRTIGEGINKPSTICDRCFKPQSGLPGDCTCA